MRYWTQNGERLRSLWFWGFGIILLTTGIAQSLPSGNSVVVYAGGFFLAVWLLGFCGELWMPIAVSFTPSGLRFERLVGAIVIPFAALQSVRAVEDEDGWKSVEFIHDKGTITTRPLNDFDILVSRIRDFIPALHVERRG